MQVPIGVSDFRKLREAGLAYVDKSRLIVELLERRGAEVVLLPRPRRFGKTLNLSMLRYFFERSEEDRAPLFEDLAVWRAGDDVRAHFQRYPVIYLTFRDVKPDNFERCWAAIRQLIKKLFNEHKFVLESPKLSELDRRNYTAILAGGDDPILYYTALGDLSRYLHLVTGERAFILIDEYDAPIHAGHVNGYRREVLDFFRAFLSSGFKDNTHLERGVLTGILRVARESIFSGLNNVAVHTLLDAAFSTTFGFTEAEVAALLAEAGLADKRVEVRGWYNGYNFGGEVIYNPWSVLNFIYAEGKPGPYWLNTSSNDLITSSLLAHAPRLQPEFEALLAGEAVEMALVDTVAFDEIDRNDRSFWALLVFAGYLRAEAAAPDPLDGSPRYAVSIPNLEIRQIYRQTFVQWFETHTRGHGANLRRLLDALLSGDAETLEFQLGALLANVISYHDYAAAELPERVYHAFLLGLFCALEPEYRVRSNRESGRGRPDVQIFPARPGRPGVLLELKVARRTKTLDAALAEGVAQARAKDYARELIAAGAAPVHAFVLAFAGKQLRVVGVELDAAC